MNPSFLRDPHDNRFYGFGRATSSGGPGAVVSIWRAILPAGFLAIFGFSTIVNLLLLVQPIHNSGL